MNYPPLVPITHRSLLPTCGGVYVVLCSVGTVLYVGRSQCLRERFVSHHKLGEFVGREGRIFWVEINDEGERRLLENRWIAEFQPPLNDAKGSVPFDDLLEAIDQGLFASQIARKFGVSRQAVSSLCRQYGLQPKGSFGRQERLVPRPPARGSDTHVYLGSDRLARVRKLATESERTAQAVIRRALDYYFENSEEAAL